jgi:hypothetical protein
MSSKLEFSQGDGTCAVKLQELQAGGLDSFTEVLVNINGLCIIILPEF